MLLYCIVFFVSGDALLLSEYVGDHSISIAQLDAMDRKELLAIAHSCKIKVGQDSTVCAFLCVKPTLGTRLSGEFGTQGK